MNIFKHGSTWLRADFHLHTMADREFLFPNPEQNRSFKKEYVAKLKEQEISLGVITNHNKFDLAEFKSLRNHALKNEIYLMAGVELSVNDGKNGVHCLIVFDYESWVKNNEDFINQFLTAAFEGIANRENENTSCNYSLNETLEKLEEHRQKGRDSFMIMAHVHQSKGFLEELEGGRIQHLVKQELFKNTVLGFQKFRKYDDINKLKQWYEKEEEIPAFLEGSDCKNIQEVGQAHKQNENEMKCYLKLGDFSFEAVKYALVHHRERVSSQAPSIQDYYLRKIIIEQNEEKDNLEIPFSPDLNTIIGVRGGGKSTLLETIRFAIGERATSNTDYKEQVVHRLVGEGKKIHLEFADKNQETIYTTERTWGTSIKVLNSEGEIIPNLQPDNFIKVAYFGQKDLEDMGKDFNEKIIKEKLLKKELDSIEEEIRQAKMQINETLNKLSKAKQELNSKEIVQNKIAVLEEKIKKFEEYNLQDLIAKELNYSNDEQEIERVIEDWQMMMKDVLEKIQEYSLSDYNTYKSKQVENQSIFQEKIPTEVQKFKKLFEDITKQLSENTDNYLLNNLLKIKKEFSQQHQALVSEFEEKKKVINDPDIDIEKHKQNQKHLNSQKYVLSALESSEAKLDSLQTQLNQELKTLQTTYRQEFDFIQKKIDKLNDLGLSFRIEMTFEGDKEEFKNQLFEYCKGGNFIKEIHIKKITEQYANLREVYQDLQNTESQLHNILSGSNLLSKFQEKFEENSYLWLTHQAPNKYTFTYRDKPLEHYSIGQKATALISFILANEDTDLFLIDQPEDDLDNFTVAKEIINRIKDLKPSTQFIFVTHNPNILVLGDSEQVIICEYDDEIQKIKFSDIGSIDKPEIQQKAINIMEGGKEAFEQRKNIYKIWKQKNS